MTKEVATANDLKALINSDTMKAQFQNALPKHLSVERFARIATTALTKTPRLRDCTRESFMKCLLDLSAMGLEPDGRNAHLIPYRNNKTGTTECTLIVDYKGKVDLAMRSGKVAVIHADVVCEHDDFEYDLGEIKRHKIDFRKPRGNVYAVYAICKMKDGTSKCEVMSVDEVESIRKRSKSGNAGPWITDWNEMAKKTPFHRLSKWLKLSAEYMDAVEHDNDLIDVAGIPVYHEPSKTLEHIVEMNESAEPVDDIANEHTQEESEPPTDKGPSRSELNKMLLDARKAKPMAQVDLEKMAQEQFGCKIADLTNEQIVTMIDVVNSK